MTLRVGARPAYTVINDKLDPIRHEESVIALETESILMDANKAFEMLTRSFHMIPSWSVGAYLSSRTMVEREIKDFTAKFSLLLTYNESLDAIRNKLKKLKDKDTPQERIFAPPLLVRTIPSPPS